MPPARRERAHQAVRRVAGIRHHSRAYVHARHLERVAYVRELRQYHLELRQWRRLLSQRERLLTKLMSLEKRLAVEAARERRLAQPRRSPR